MKYALFLFILFFTFLTFGQGKNDTIKVIAVLISHGQGSKIYIAKYKVLKVIKGALSNDTIDVGYSFYTEYQNSPDTALLNLTTYTVDTTVKDYYIFRDYDAKKRN